MYNEQHIASDDGCRFFVRSWIPDGKAKAIVVLVHGLSDHSGRFLFVGETFARQSYLFFAPDMRGNGKSGGLRGHFDSIEQVESDLLFLLKRITGLHPGLPVLLYGQSMGGGLAIRFALSHPERVNAVIASSPWLALAKPPAGFIQVVASALLPLFPKLQLSNGLKSKDLCHDTSICAAYDSDPLIHWKISLSTFFIMKKLEQYAMMRAPALKIPMLLLHSKADPITSFGTSEQFAEKANNRLTFKSYDNYFHELHNEPEKDLILKAILDWIEGLNL